MRCSEHQQDALRMLCEPALEWTLDAEPTVRKAGQNVPALVTQHARGPFQVEWTLRNSVLAPWARSPTDTVDACAILLSQRRALRANFGMCYIEWDGHLSFVVAPDCGNSSEPSPLSEPSPRAYVARPEELFVFVINKEESEASSVLFRLRRGEDSQAVSLTSCQIGPLAWSAPSAERAPTHAICRPFSYRYGSGHLYGALSLYGDKLVGGEMADLLLRGKTPFSTLASVIFGANGCRVIMWKHAQENACAGRYNIAAYGSSPAVSVPGGRYVFWNPAPGATLLSGANPAALSGSGMYPSDNLGIPGARLASQPWNVQIGVAPPYPNWLPLRDALQVQFQGYSTAMSNVLTRRNAQTVNEGVSARTFVYAPLGPQFASGLSEALKAQDAYERAQLGIAM